VQKDELQVSYSAMWISHQSLG